MLLPSNGPCSRRHISRRSEGLTTVRIVLREHVIQVKTYGRSVYNHLSMPISNSAFYDKFA